MIETTFVRLLQAADMLGTDADTLLIAAVEGRVRAYWLLNEIIQAERGLCEEIAHEPGQRPDRWVLHQRALEHFMFVPLDRNDTAELLRQDSVHLYLDLMTLSTPADDGTYWKPDFVENDHVTDLIATRETVFFKRVDIEAIRANGLASENTVKADAPNKSAGSRSQNTLLCILAVALDQAGVDPAERGAAAQVVKWTEINGTPVDHGTVKGYLDKLPEAIAGRAKAMKS